VLNESREIFARRLFTNSKSISNWEKAVCVPNTLTHNRLSALLKKYKDDIDLVDVDGNIPEHVTCKDINNYLS
jgi:hypothetical protein